MPFESDARRKKSTVHVGGASTQQEAGLRALVGCFQWNMLPAVGLVERDCLDFLQVSMACASPHHDFVRGVTLIQLVVQTDCH